MNKFERKVLFILEKLVNMLKKYEDNNEVWLDDENLTIQFNCFTKSWQKKYGETLPRTQAIVDGEHKTHWMYARNKIQRMFDSGEIKNLSTKKQIGKEKTYEEFK